MELSLRQVATIFRVSDTQILNWIDSDHLPANLVSDQYRFYRAELLEWAATAKLSFDPSIYADGNGDLTRAGTNLADALQAGGILENVKGREMHEVLSIALRGLPIPDSIMTEEMIDLFLARERLGSTAIGGGIAVPHPRKPTLLPVTSAIVRLCYLSHPLSIDTPDNKPVDKLFLMICPTAHEHLQLLARLSALLQTESVSQAFGAKLAGPELFEVLRIAERSFENQEA